MYYKPLYNFLIIKVTTVYIHCQEHQKVISDPLKKVFTDYLLWGSYCALYLVFNIWHEQDRWSVPLREDNVPGNRYSIITSNF